MSEFIAFWLHHAPILSILIPAFTGFLLVLLGNPGAGSLYQDWRQPIRRHISMLSALLGLGVAISYVALANTGEIFVYHLAQWSAPFGIILVLDRLSALMVLLTYVLAVPVIWYASHKWDQRGRYFHAMSHFLLMGVCGAFLTGDLFNLFVFFEILLMSSYVLLIYAQGQVRFQWGIHYVVINLFASALFLIGLGMMYASVGSLNMADIGRLTPLLDADQQRMAVASGLLLFTVFGIKAAMLPVGFWLPKTYAVVATPVAALFTIMTKVGIYAILRVNGTVFNDDLSQEIWQNLLLIIGLASSLYGVIAALAAVRLRRFVGFMILSSIGTILTAIAIATPEAWAATLYYTVHSTLIAAVFYLLCGWITSQRGELKDHIQVAVRMKQHNLIATCFFLISLMMAGLPPFSGFIGKVFILNATTGHPAQFWIIGVILIVSLLSIIGFVRVGFILFWQARPMHTDPHHPEYETEQALPNVAPKANDTAIYIMLSILVAYMLWASPVYQYTLLAGQQINNTAEYQQLILHRDAQNNIISILPYDKNYAPQTKYGGEQKDKNAHTIPYIIHEDSLNGVNISYDKKKQITEQLQQQGVTQP